MPNDTRQFMRIFRKQLTHFRNGNLFRLFHHHHHWKLDLNFQTIHTNTFMNTFFSLCMKHTFVWGGKNSPIGWVSVNMYIRYYVGKILRLSSTDARYLNIHSHSHIECNDLNKNVIEYWDEMMMNFYDGGCGFSFIKVHLFLSVVLKKTFF